MARLLPILSLILFAVAFYAVGAFVAWSINPKHWDEWLRLAAATSTLGAWLWDMRHHNSGEAV